MERLAELQARLSDATNPLNDDELAELETLLVEAFDAADGEVPDVETMCELGGQIQAVRTEKGKREEALAEAQAEAERLRAGIHVVAPEAAAEEPAPEGEPAEEAGTEGTEGEEPAPVEAPAAEEAPAEPAETPAPAEAPAAVAAAAARPALSTVRPPAAHRPQPANRTQPVAITASGDIPGVSAGATLKPEQVGRAMAEKIHAVSRSRGGRFNVARMTAQFAEGMQLSGDPHENLRRINAVRQEMQERTYGGFDQALVAAGGICAPEAPRYDMFTVGSDARPIRDRLPRFQATRGGITFIRPPVLTDVSGAVGIWTAANDANPSSPTTKPILTISCGDQVTVNIDAITLRAQVGNFDLRTFPENFRAWWGLAKVAHSRTGDTELWDAMVADARTVAVTTGELLGAARDILENLDQAAAQFRSRHRIPQTAIVEVILPDWVPSLMRADFTRQLPGDNAVSVTDAEITQMFRDRNISPVWTPDTGQEYGTQNDNAALNRWDTNVEALMYLPGHFIFLDGGELDLGTEIRDSTLNATNDAEAFLETFEQVAAVGPQALHITMDVCPSGQTSGTVDIAPCTTGS